MAPGGGRMTSCPDGCEGCRRAVCALGWGDAEPERATGFLRRLAGLSAGKRDRQRIMAFPSCSSVHTLTMHRPIDIAFIAHDGSVLARHDGVGPGRVLACPGAACALERVTGAHAALDGLLRSARLLPGEGLAASGSRTGMGGFDGSAGPGWGRAGVRRASG